MVLPLLFRRPGPLSSPCLPQKQHYLFRGDDQNPSGGHFFPPIRLNGGAQVKWGRGERTATMLTPSSPQTSSPFAFCLRRPRSPNGPLASSTSAFCRVLFHTVSPQINSRKAAQMKSSFSQKWEGGKTTAGLEDQFKVFCLGN